MRMGRLSSKSHTKGGLPDRVPLIPIMCPTRAGDMPQSIPDLSGTIRSCTSAILSAQADAADKNA
jgi:hypothetical protein